jgi:hypothetical protein
MYCWKDIPSQENDHVYLAIAIHMKDGATQLPISANRLRTIQELLDFFLLSNRDYTIYVVYKQEDHQPTYDDNILKNLSSIKKESIEIKKEVKKVKKEDKKIKKKPKEIKQKPKRERSALYKLSPAIYIKNEAFSHQHTTLETIEDFKKACLDLNVLFSTPLAHYTRRQITRGQ